ncbi:MAG: phenylalanine--tRNA ligase subunit alpha [Euryarchaeota archaeon]|nr:phenylalanine--tRNA ligase subunit alpha [Euryarchaeota archaeon]
MLGRNEALVLRAVEGEAELQELVERTGLSESAVNRAVYWLVRKGLVRVQEETDALVELGEEGRQYLAEGLPERRAVELLRQSGGRMSVGELGRRLGEQAKIAMGWLARKGLARISGGMVELTEAGSSGERTADELLLERLGRAPLRLSTLSEEERRALELLRSRQEVVVLREVRSRRVVLTEEGRRWAAEAEVGESQLTHEMLRTGSWRGKRFRAYDVTLPAPEVLPAKLHPLRRIMDEIRAIFLQMGFREIEGPLVESAFWNFDALFVPQDHPAREMQDTFYLAEPARQELPDRELVEAVRRAHTGMLRGSKGWGGEWRSSEAERALLRTHTTSATIRYLASAPELPAKVFCIGRVFRKERITYRHLPEFHQVEGIVAGDVGFAHLLGILREFYRRMGFERLRFRPGYFPYTEPSLEVEVYLEEKRRWLELGGAGIFRPEVTEPLGITVPVLAWGLGVERLAMLRLGIEDIRMLYMGEIPWIQSREVR